MGQANYINGFEVATHDHALDIPLHWRKPQMMFVNLMSEVFHEDVPLSFINKVTAYLYSS
jgi:protein gp37